MEEIVLLDAIERYLDGEMTAQEKSYFEDLRRNNAEVDQLVVEHQLFLNQFNNYSGQKEFKALLNETHNRLVEEGVLQKEKPVATVRILSLWKKHKRTIAVAASIACVTALTISGMLSYVAPKNTVANQQQIQLLSREINKVKRQQNEQSIKIAEINNQSGKNTDDASLNQTSAGSSFLIDTKGYLITNSHVIDNANSLKVSNNGKDYYAVTVYNDVANDLAILKIEDKSFISPSALPYSLRKSQIELSEEIYTLGYPRNSIVFDRGYLSAQSGYNDDTLSIQISVSANPGNSGGPVFDKNGNVIGVLNSREKNADGVVFANKAVNIGKILEKLKDQDTTYRSVKLPSGNQLKGKELTQQVKQLKDYVYMVKVFSK